MNVGAGGTEMVSQGESARLGSQKLFHVDPRLGAEQVEIGDPYDSKD